MAKGLRAGPMGLSTQGIINVDRRMGLVGLTGMTVPGMRDNLKKIILMV